MDTRSLTNEQLEGLIAQNQFIFDEYFDLDFAICLNQQVVSHIADHYFRAKFVGFDPFPERNNPDRPLIYASNHSGMAFPWDGIIFVSGIFRLCNYSSDGTRPLTSPMLSMSTLMNPFLIRNLWKKVGSIDATTLNFETLMQSTDYNLLIYPEGVPGIGKGFHKRYQLQKLSTSAIRMSLKYNTDIIPVATINGEYINPWHFSNDLVNKVMNLIGIPFLPLGWLTLILLLQPWLFYYALPANLTYVRGRRIRPGDYINKPFDLITRQELEQVRDQIGAEMQEQLTEAVRVYGQRPYDLKTFWKGLSRNIGKFPFCFPPLWPYVFSIFEEEYSKHGPAAKVKVSFWNMCKVVLKRPFLFSYFIPVLGWIPILIKGYRHAQLSKNKS